MKQVNQWFVWRLTWDATKQKYTKVPCHPDGGAVPMDAALPSNWMRYDSALRLVESLRASAADGVTYTLGFWMTADAGYWFLDLDECATDGVLTPFASQMVSAFPGAMMEWSSSKRGVHVIGRCAQPMPAHRSRDIHKLKMEFYTQDRGIAFGLDGQYTGDPETCHDAMVAQLVAQYFPPRPEGTGGDGPRAEWRGPADDDVLIERMLAAKPSAASVFGGKPSLRQLWNGEAERNSESDMALASHLAFWTGCDEDRMERLMRRSGLRREKWDAHRTYLRDLTIANACAGCEQVYQEPQRSVVAQSEMYGQPAIPVTVSQVRGEVVSAEVMQRIDSLMDMVTGCGTLLDMHNLVIPAIREAGVPAALGETLVRAVNKQLDFWNAKIPVAKLRALLFPPVVVGSAGGQDAPAWVQKHCYVKDGDYFMDMENGATLTYQGFCAEYARLMPMRDSGARENPVDWALNRWGMRTVHKVGYRPDQGPYFEWDNLEYANTYNPNSLPALPTEWTEKGLKGIEAFQLLLWDMCARRQEVYEQVLWWMAHNVQRPGIKIRWSPLIKGTHGDGKSLLAAVLRSAMGFRNVGTTSNSTLRNSGGFTDWAVGHAVNVIEEIWIVGKERHVLYNATKEFISNDVVNINAKGGKTYSVYNTTNHLAFSNQNDAVPLEPEDRRWLVVFTPWASLQAMYQYSGIGEQGWKDRAKTVDAAMRDCPGELRAWLLSVQIGPAFDKDSSALRTPERDLMISSSTDSIESIALAIVQEGAPGICSEILCSNLLTHALKIRALTDGLELPKGQALNHMLTRMGFSKIPKQIKWNGSTNTVWVKNGFNGDIREALNRTSTQQAQ